MDRFRAAVDEMIMKMKASFEDARNPVEILLDEHLQSQTIQKMSAVNASGIPTRIMNEFASRTHNVVDYGFIMERIWEILLKEQQNPILMKKTLTLLHFLIINGAPRVLTECKQPERTNFLRDLSKDYNRDEFEQYRFSQHLDIGAGTRKVAGEVHSLITNEEELEMQRQKAEELHQKLMEQGLRASYPSPRTTIAVVPPNSPVTLSMANGIQRPPAYSDSYPAFDDLEGKIITHTNLDEERAVGHRQEVSPPRPVAPRQKSPRVKEADLLGLEEFETMSLSSSQSGPPPAPAQDGVRLPERLSGVV